MKYRWIEHVEASRHDAFVAHSVHCNLLQSAKWAEVKENWNHVILGVEDEQGNLVASALCLIKPLPLGFTMFYIPRGPVMDYQNAELVEFMVKSLRQYAKKHRCVMIKLDPPVHKQDFYLEEPQDGISEEAKIALANLQAAGAHHLGFHLELDATIQPRFHANVMKCDNFREQLPKHTKRHIQTAIKKHVVMKLGGSEYLDDFVHLLKLTEARQGILLRDASYFRLIMDTYGEDAHLFMAYLDGTALCEDIEKRLTTEKQKAEKLQGEKQEQAQKQVEKLQEELQFLNAYQAKGMVPAAGALVVKFGDTVEMLYMGSDNELRKYMAPYLSHVTPMEWAFANGCTSCNMGGIAGTLDDGLTKFKSNFHPLINEYMGEFDIPTNALLYRLANIALNLRKKRNSHE